MMLKITLVALLCSACYAFPPEHLDHVIHDYAEGIENLKRTARDIKFIDDDGDVIKIIKSEPIFVKGGKVVYLDRSEIVRISRPPTRYFEIESFEVNDSESYSDEVVIDDIDDEVYVLESGDVRLCNYVKVYRRKK